MPINAMKKTETLLSHVLQSIRPGELIAHIAKVDRAGYFRNFKGYRIEKFGRPQLETISRKEMFERNNEIWAEVMVLLWNNNNRPVYNAMHEQVSTVNENVEEIESIDDETAHKFVDALLEDHILEDVLLVTHLNDVRFSDSFIRERLEGPLEIDRPALPETEEPEHVHGPDCNH